jgi:hypothetical protein
LAYRSPEPEFGLFGSFLSLLIGSQVNKMKCTGTPKKVLATLFLHASGNLTPVISLKISTRTGAIPI